VAHVCIGEIRFHFLRHLDAYLTGCA
jgi:hypothetical protein